MAGKEYQMAFSIGAKLQGQFGAAFKSAQTDVAALQNQIQSLNKQQGDITAYQKQQKAVEQTKAKLQLLQQQYANLKASMGENGEASVDLKNKMLAKELQIERTTQRLEGQEAQLQATGNALNEAGIDTQNLTSASNQLESEISSLKGQQEELAAATDETSQSMSGAADSMMELIGALGLAEALKTGYEAMKACTEEAIAFENSMASVKRTVGGDDAFLSDLGASFKELSTVIPISTAELTEIATTAGQLGIAQGDVEQFTTVMAKLATTTDLTANDAATMLAQFANITGLKDYDRLGSVIAELGDATATTASKVVQMSQGMAASASQAGMSSTDIMAISAALGSLGIEAQAGATSMSQLISTLYKATETGEGLKDFASVAGMSAEQFKQAWATDAVGAMNAFIQGLNDTERNGKSAIVILDELGITNVRQTKAILGLASAGDLLSRTISQASNAWNSNTALTQKAQVMYETTQAKLTMLNNAFNNTKIAIGDAFTPIVSAGAEALTGMLKPVTSFIEQNPALVRAFAAAAAVIGTVIVALTAYAAVAKIAAAASALLTAAIPGMKLIMGVTLAVAGLAAGISLLVDAFSGGHQSMEELDAEFDSLNEQIQEQQEIIDLRERYKQLKKELDDVGKSADTELLLSATIEKHGFENADDVKLVASLSDVIENKKGELKQILELNGAQDITDDDIAKVIELGAAIDTDSGELEQYLALLGIEDISEEDIAMIRSLAAEIVTAEGVLKQTVALFGIENLTAEDIQLIASLNDAIATNSGELKQLLELNGAQDITDDDIKKIASLDLAITSGEGSLKETLSVLGIEDASKENIDKIKNLAAAIKSDSGKLSETLAVYGLESYDDMVAACALASQVSGADVESTLSITVSETGYEAVQKKLAKLQAKAADLQSKATSAKDDFSTAKADLEAMKERYSELEARLKHAGSKSDKSTIRAEMESLSGEIDKQEGKVTKLDTAYTEVSAELLITSSAANDLAAKEAELASVKEKLAAASSGVADALSGESDELDRQIQAAEDNAVLAQAALRVQVYENLTSQAKQYADAVKTSAEYAADFDPRLQRASNAQKWLGMTAEEVNEEYQSLLHTLNEMQCEDDFDPFGADYQAKIRDVQDLSYLMGAFFDDVSQYANKDYDWVKNMGWVKAGQSYWEQTIKDMYTGIAKYKEDMADLDVVMSTYIQNLVDGVSSGAVTLDEVEARLTGTFSSMESGAELVQQIMVQVRAELEGAAEAAEDMGTGMDSTKASAEEVNAAIGPIIAQMEALGAAYQEAYDKAYESMDGQFKLFEQAPELTKTSVDDMIAALQSQQAYMEQYAANLQAAAEMGISDGLLAKLSDGSTESAAYLASIVSDGATKIDELNTAFAGVEEGKSAFADTVAEMQTDFSTKMQELQTQLETTVSEMNMTSEAAAAGSSTVQAFADAASSLTPTVQAAFQKVANAAKNALKVSISAGPNGINAYASGTQNAEPGFALVGENGPELVYFRGGEQVATAEETEALSNRRALDADPVSAIPAPQQGGNTTHIEVKPEYTINGSADPDELRSVLNEQTQNLRAMVEDIMEDIESDRERSVYA